MLISNDQIKDWKDLQELVANFFKEMGYEAKVGVTVQLSGRGKKEIDVFVKDPRASVNQVYLIECKDWETKIPQEKVHSHYTVMQGSGANTGFIISKAGFQTGAHEAIKNTNIHLLNFEELQHTFGRQWLLYQTEKIEHLKDKLKIIYDQHFEQFSPAPIHNNMFLKNVISLDEMILLQKRVCDLLLAANTIPNSYDAKMPIEIAGCIPDAERYRRDAPEKWRTEFKSLRELCLSLKEGMERCIEHYEALSSHAHKHFDGLSDEEQNKNFNSVLRSVAEELPIRSYKDVLGNQYEKLIADRNKRL